MSTKLTEPSRCHEMKENANIRGRRPISDRTYLFSRRQFHTIVIFHLKSISDLDSGPLSRVYGEFVYANIKIVES